ncbi:phosphatidate cytidylyltransferase [Methyloterricola oryzae]|uniref:phosphatidate cytidylyltransferase n=1 Tax=Methyloterricola oryzae TaxID=1495050 RepID=UPI0005EB6BCB|nr:phosphatidate cytidylyltransferase [Methyloterricola oryzae]
MLRNRVITALVLAPLIIVAILFLPAFWFAVVWGAVVAVASWEWADLAGLSTPVPRLLFVAACGAFMFTGPQWGDFALDWLPWVVVAWWFVFSILVRRIPDKLLAWNYPTALKLGIGLFVLIASWILLVWVRANFGTMQVLYLLLLVWLADVAAYFAGKRFGLTKLSPEISPGKTVEGLYGALVAAALFAVAVGFYKGLNPVLIADFALISVLAVVVSVIGDLFESLAKRVRGVKDSGSLLPGHGGVLDRIDSLLAAVSVFYLGSFLREIFL